MQIRRSLTLVTLLLTTAPLAAQDVEFIRALERAQQQRPGTLTPHARIAPAAEPGTPLVIRGRVFGPDGKTAAAGAVVFAYHTDGGGLYSPPGSPAHTWRLRGWAAADADGRFEFQTIRPGPYPAGRIPAHVHFTLFLPAGGRYHAGELQFEDDALVSAAEREAAKREGAFATVQPVRTGGGRQHVDVQLRVDPRQKF
jgi:protocatechuate 3,4-dioxygenase beta subunit